MEIDLTLTSKCVFRVVGVYNICIYFYEEWSSWKRQKYKVIPLFLPY